MKKQLRTMYFIKLEESKFLSKFRLERVDGPSRPVSATYTMREIEALIENGNRIVIVPREFGLRIYQNGSFAAKLEGKAAEIIHNLDKPDFTIHGIENVTSASLTKEDVDKKDFGVGPCETSTVHHSRMDVELADIGLRAEVTNAMPIEPIIKERQLR